MVAPTQNREFKERRVRVKADTAADDPAGWFYLDPESFTVTVGGTETDGPYTITVVPDHPPSGTISFPITVVRATTPATNTEIGAALDAAADVLLAVTGSARGDVLSDYLSSVSNDSGVVTFVGLSNPFSSYTVTVSAPAPGTLTLAPDDNFPVTYNSLGWGPVAGSKSFLEITIIPVNVSGVPLDPNGATVDLTCLRVIDRSSTTDTNAVVPPGVGAAVTETSFPIGEIGRIQYSGGRIGFHIATFTGTITGLDAFEVWIREATS